LRENTAGGGTVMVATGSEGLSRGIAPWGDRGLGENDGLSLVSLFQSLSAVPMV